MFRSIRRGEGERGVTPAGAWPTIVTKAKTLWRFCFSFLWISCVSFIRSNKSKIYTQTHTHIDFYCLQYTRLICLLLLLLLMLGEPLVRLICYIIKSRPHNTNNITHTPHLPAQLTLFALEHRKKEGFASALLCFAFVPLLFAFLWHCVRAGQQLGSKNNNNN